MLIEQLISYDDTSGTFQWKDAPGRTHMVGRRVGTKNRDGYLRIYVGGEHVMAHRLAWYMVHGKWPSGQVDHVDGNKLNNAIGNLRVVTSRANKQNRHGRQSNNKSGFLGVFPERGRWSASIGLGGRRSKRLGSFDTPELAHQAYLSAKRRLHEGNTL
jgi:hypothetical protein